MNIRTKKIISLYKEAADFSNILKTKTREVQQALIDAGYPLPNFGADGRLGKETYMALSKFKKENGLADTSTLSEEELNILKGINKNKVSVRKMPAPVSSEIAGLGKEIALPSPNPDTSSYSDTALLFGDSQMQGGIGEVLHSKFGGKRLSKAGSSAKYWVSNSELELELKKKPKKIVIQLNGNGIAGTSELLKKIKRITPGSEITWYGSPPATLRQNSSYAAVKSPDKLISFNKTRKSNNDTVAGMLAASGMNGAFIDPFDEIFRVSTETVEPYRCKSCDGVHVPKSVAQSYYA
jgi:hypothetical protein